MDSNTEITLKVPVRDAIAMWHFSNANGDAPAAFDAVYKDTRWSAVQWGIHHSHSAWSNIDMQLGKLGIDPRDLKLDDPIVISGNRVEFEENQIRVGCAVVSKETLKEMVKRLESQ